jgi:hypothetical protein
VRIDRKIGSALPVAGKAARATCVLLLACVVSVPGGAQDSDLVEIPLPKVPRVLDIKPYPERPPKFEKVPEKTVVAKPVAAKPKPAGAGKPKAKPKRRR